MSDIQNMYRDTILELNRHPLNKRQLRHFDKEHIEYNTSCGDEIRIQILFDNDVITDIGHQGHGCAISQATISLLTEAVKNKTQSSILQMGENDVFDLLGFTPIYTRKKCATICLDAIQNTIRI